MIRKRRVRVFISYSREDRKSIDSLFEWLLKNGCDPVIDEEGIKEGDKLNAKLKAMIDGCDGFLAFGTASYMRSLWCKKEVQYACNSRKEYLPVLFEPLVKEEIAEWFTRSDSLEGEVVYGECFNQEFGFLKSFLRRLSERKPIRIQNVVLLGIVLLFILPAMVSWTIRERVGQANAEIQELQAWIEKVNRDIDSRPTVESLVRGTHDSKTSYTIEYRNAASAELIGRDSYLDGQLNMRQYFLNEREVGVDTILIAGAPDGSLSLRKKRVIYIQSEKGMIIQEIFDSIGNLVSKRAGNKSNDESKWKRYTDVGRSVYPPVLFYPYR